MVETILGCKWSLTIYELLREGITRPGAMERSVAGLTRKVMNDCLRRNLELGLIEKVSFPEIPPRVEYRFSPLGIRFQSVLAAVAEFQSVLERKELSAAQSSARGAAKPTS